MFSRMKKRLYKKEGKPRLLMKGRLLINSISFIDKLGKLR